MNGLTAFLEKYFVPVAAKIGSQKHLVALRDAFISTMPITMAGSIAVLLMCFLGIFQLTGDGQDLWKRCNHLSGLMDMYTMGR